MIYLDYAATSFHRPACVARAVTEAMEHMGNAGRGAHGAGLLAARTVYETRLFLAELFHGPGPEQVAFTANGTESLNLAIGGLLGPGDHVITTAMEHNSVLRPLYRLEDEGLKLTVLDAGRDGRVSYEEMEAAIGAGTRAVVCTHASNVTGNVNDLKRIGSLCREHGLLFIVDAAQTAGHLPIDMEEMGIDVLCFTGHKGLLGPQGTGGICVRRGLKISPLKVGGSGIQSQRRGQPEEMPEALEAGTLNAHGIAGLGAALGFIREREVDRLGREGLASMWQFCDGVAGTPGVTVYGDFSDRDVPRAPVVSLNIGDEDSGQVAVELEERFGIQVRAGLHCAPLMHRALGTVRQGAVRFSFSYAVTPKEVQTAVEAVRILAREAQP